MTSPAEQQATAAALRRCADDLESAMDGLAPMSAEAWDCPAATAFESELRSQSAQLGSVAAGLRATAAELDAAAAAQLLADQQAVAGVVSSGPSPVGPRSGVSPASFPVGGTGPV